MELEFDITEAFSEDIGQLQEEEQERISQQINIISDSLLNGRMVFLENSSIPHLFKLKGGLDSSLFLIKADQHNRIVAAVDEDPIYDRILLTLFRLVDSNAAEQVYKEVGEHLYKGMGVL